MQRICYFKKSLVVFSSVNMKSLEMSIWCTADLSYLWGHKKEGCVFGNVLLVVTSISNVGEELWAPPKKYSRCSLQMSSHFHGLFPSVKGHPKRYISWEVGVRWWKKLAILVRKKCFINSFGKRKWVLSQTESLKASTSSGFTVWQGAEWLLVRAGKELHSLTGLAQITLLLSTKSVLHEVFQLPERTWLTLSYKSCSTERGKNYSQEEVRELLLEHHNVTSHLLKVCRQLSKNLSGVPWCVCI